MTDAQQFEVFMRHHQNLVYSTAMRLLANAAEAQDVAQEVFLKAFERFDQLRDNPSAAGWLKTVATNLSLNHLSRYRARWSFFSELSNRGREEGEEMEVEFAATQTGETDLAKVERSVLVEQALQKLPVSQRVALVLYHLEGLTYEQIAVKLGVSMGKLKTDIFRGRETLRRNLQFKLDLKESLEGR